MAWGVVGFDLGPKIELGRQKGLDWRDGIRMQGPSGHNAHLPPTPLQRGRGAH